ncbi:ABC transporter permease subunit [Dehalococcoides mccartyi]|nr:ABC transporter permease subunit [Dehalococcoides mccartyi]
MSNQWLTSFDSNNSRLDAYGAGILNTVRLVIIGIILTTIIGVLAGIARLSDNWLVSRLATLYVETVRNTPLLVQIIIWYTVVFLQLPKISEPINVLDKAYLSNRALALPYVSTEGSFIAWLIALVIAGVLAFGFRNMLNTRQNADGKNRHAMRKALGLFLIVAVVSFFATGSPLNADIPAIQTTAIGLASISGGLQVSPEFAAVLFGLVIYTGAFIAEIVRSGIQALPRGQSEAAAALGLSGYQRMTLIILPQALRIIIPPLTNQFLNLTKNSSLAVAIAYPEIVWVGTTIINGIAHAVPIFIMLFATYLALSLLISVAMNAFNKRVQLAGR